MGDTPVHTAVIDRKVIDYDWLWPWAAGFIDGEGSIGIELRRDRASVSGRLVLTVVQKHPEPLERLRDAFGGNLDWQRGSGPRGTDRWRWRVASGTALDVLQRIRPFLIAKRDEADIAIAYQMEQQQGRKTDPAIVNQAREALANIKRREGVKPSVPVA